MRLFHGTTTSRLDDINDNGLVPWVSHDNSARTVVYLTSDEDTAWLYAHLAQDRRGGDQVLIEIDFTALDPAKFAPDDYELQDQIDDIHEPDYSGEGTRSCVAVDERLRAYKRWQDVPAELSLETTKQIVYTDVVPASAILNVEIVPRQQARPRSI